MNDESNTIVRAGELLMQQPGIGGLHCVTATNALHYAYTASGNDETRRLMMLQCASFLTMFKQAITQRCKLDESLKIDTLTSLRPGETRQVAVVVTTGKEDATEGSRHHVTLVAEAEGGLGDDAKAVPEAVASVRVVPKSESGGFAAAGAESA